VKELFSVNAAGHKMSEPRTLNDLAEVLHHERRETLAHYEGVVNQHRRAADLVTESVKFANEVPHAPVEYAVGDLLNEYRAAVTGYHEGMSQALAALKLMQQVAEKALRQKETAKAIAKQQAARGGRPVRH
jgi:hypothetical protein